MNQKQVYESLEKMAEKKDPWKKEAWYYSLSTKNLLKLIKMVPHASILEVGCAQGDFTRELRKISDDVTAIDVSKSEIERAKKNVSGVTFVVSSLEDFSTQRKFDVIVCSEVLYYIQNKQNALRKLQELGKHVVTSHFLADLPHVGLKSISYEFSLRKFPLRKRILEWDFKEGLFVIKSLRRLQMLFLSFHTSLSYPQNETLLEFLVITV